MEHEDKKMLGPVSEEALDRLVDGNMLDRMVDGELSDEERNHLLASLDAAAAGEEKDGPWRKLALAYVEAQTWQQDLGAFRAEAEPPRKLSKDSKAGKRSTRSEPVKERPAKDKPETMRLVLAMAASFLIAIGVTWQFRDGGSDGAGVSGEIATQPGSTTSDSTQLANSTTQPQPSATESVGPNVAIPSAPPANAPIFNVGTDAGSGSSAATVPPNIADTLRRLRHRIERRRSLVPVEMEDGSRKLIPVEDLEVQYLGDDAYQ